MDFYLLPKRFLTDLAVNAKSCVNSNLVTLFMKSKMYALLEIAVCA